MRFWNVLPFKNMQLMLKPASSDKLTLVTVHSGLKTAFIECSLNKLLTPSECHSTGRIGNTLASGWFWWFSQKNSSFRLPYQRPSSSANCARELFNGSNGSASPVDCTRKKNFCLGVRVFWPTEKISWLNLMKSFHDLLKKLVG